MSTERSYWRHLNRRIHPNWSGTCANAGHRACGGFRREASKRANCECPCHLHVCPRCKQPTVEKTAMRLRGASAKVAALASKVQELANELTAGLIQ